LSKKWHFESSFLLDGGFPKATLDYCENLLYFFGGGCNLKIKPIEGSLSLHPNT